MDIHKPKPWRGGPEFLKEIGTIVIGVLIALGGEQAVERLHRGAEVREARGALREEIKLNATQAVITREEVNCIRPQMDAYAAWAKGAGPKPPPTRTGLALFGFSAWESLKTTPVPNMPLRERMALDQFYETLRNSESGIQQRRTAMTILFGAYERSQLRAEDAGHVLDAVGMERRIGGFQRAQSQWIVAEAKALGVEPVPIDQQGRNFLDWECGRGGRDPFPDEG